MARTAAWIAMACTMASCYTGPTYTKPGPDGTKQAMEQALQKCEAYATANCSPGTDGRNVCLKARTKQCMQGEGWTEN